MEWNYQIEWNHSQNIFHMECTESMWNDMESTWNPHGIRGEGKDLHFPDVLSKTSMSAHLREWWEVVVMEDNH